MPMEIVFESVSTGPSSTKLWCNPDGAQTFKAKSNHNITAVEINWGRVYTTEATVTVSIEGVDEDGKPDGNTLAESSPFAYNDLIYDDIRKDKISFITPCDVIEDTFYAVVMTISTHVSTILLLAKGSQPSGWEIYREGPSWVLYTGYGAIGIRIYGHLLIPTVSIQEVTNIEHEQAKAHGTILDTGGEDCSARGFYYNKTGNPTIEDNIVEDVGSFGIGAYYKYLLNLDPGQKYYVIAWAFNAAGYGYSEEVDFETLSYATDRTGKANIETIVNIILVKTPIVNIKATKLAGHLTLYGEILESEIINIVERGFEYKIQDNEPEEEDTGTEVKETGEFEIGEYHLSSWDTFNDLYCAEDDTIWWFRAYLKDTNGTKHKAKIWMKNVPIMTTSECTDTTSFSTKGHGELTDIGANIVTERGFYVIKEFTGSIFDIHKYTYHGFIVLNLVSTTQYAPNGVLIGWLWVGKLAKIVSTTNEYGYDLEEYELGIGMGMGDALLPNDIYKVKAFGKNQLGRGFGGEVEITTSQVITEPEAEPEGDEPIESPTTAIKTVKVGNLPVGYKVIRIGIKYGRTPSCNEGMVYEDGEWYNGESVTFFIVDLIPGEKYYESPFMTIEDPGGEQDNIEDPDPIEEFPPIEPPDFPDFPDIEFPLPDLVGIDYAIIIKEIKCSIIADQSIIDKYGRRRTLSIKNNLIQTLDFCISVRDDYLNRFQELKLKIDIDYDIPLPFEREDTILLAYGQINYKTDGNGVIGAKADGEGIISGQMSILTKIRKININAKTEEAILTLELEV